MVDYLSDIADSRCSLYRLANVAFTAFSIAMKWVAVGVLVVWFSTIFIAFSGALEKMPLFAATAVYEVGFSFIFILLYLVMLFLVLDIGRLVHIVPKAWLFDNGYTSIGIFAVMLLLFSYGNIHYNNKVREQIDIKTNKAICLDKKSTKIVLLSDLHLGYHNRRSDFKKWVDMINAEQPELILIAGDIIDNSVRPLMEENVAEEFHRLKAPVYACLGNHEYYSNQPKARRFYREAGITLLQDSVAKIGNLCIIGRDDRTNMQRKSLAMIMEEARKKDFISDLHLGKHSNEFLILLDHQPYHWKRQNKTALTSSLVVTPITDRFGLSPGLPMHYTRKPMAHFKRAIPDTTLVLAWESGVENFA